MRHSRLVGRYSLACLLAGFVGELPAGAASGLILASQSASHFPHEICSNAASLLVLKPQTNVKARLNAANVGVEPDALMALKGRGDGFFRLGNATAQPTQVKRLT